MGEVDSGADPRSRPSQQVGFPAGLCPVLKAWLPSDWGAPPAGRRAQGLT